MPVALAATGVTALANIVPDTVAPPGQVARNAQCAQTMPSRPGGMRCKQCPEAADRVGAPAPPGAAAVAAGSNLNVSSCGARRAAHGDCDIIHGAHMRQNEKVGRREDFDP